MIAALLALAVSTSSAAPIALPPKVVLAQYAEALTQLVEPSAMTFEYTIAQSGANTIFETHRVYRSGDRVRDETIEADSHLLPVPAVRVSSAKPFHYALSRVAPRAANYAFAFQRAVLTGRHFSYVFMTTPRVPGDFAITSVTIDGLSFLPSMVLFTTTSGGVTARGMLAYAKADNYWMIQEAAVDAKLEAGLASERLTFRNFQFPASLPAETFRS